MKFTIKDDERVRGGTLVEAAEPCVVVITDENGARWEGTAEIRMRGTFALESKHLDDGTIFVRHRELPVYGYGETLAEALNGFAEMFELQWRALVEGHDVDLAEDAILARRQFRDAVQDIHTFVHLVRVAKGG